jgi:hypothetical protein
MFKIQRFEVFIHVCALADALGGRVLAAPQEIQEQVPGRVVSR